MISKLTQQERLALARELKEAEEQEFVRQQRERSADLQARVARSRIEKIDRLLSEARPYRDVMVSIKAQAEAELAALADPQKLLDRYRQSMALRRQEELRDTLDAIASGPGSYGWGGDVVTRVIATGLRPLPGRIHPLDGRFSLPRTERWIKELEEEREQLAAKL